MKKKCSTCKKQKNKNDFSIRRASKDGLNCSCKKCVSLKKRDPIKTKQNHLLHYYGLSLPKYTQMHMIQKGRCAICKRKIPLLKGAHVDHCHKTRKVRGLLCTYCNNGLANFKDDTILLSRAIEYLLNN